MNPAPPPERPEPPEGYRLLTITEKLNEALPNDALVFIFGEWRESRDRGCACSAPPLPYATRTPAPEAVAGERTEPVAVGGRLCQRSIAEMERASLVTIGREQEKLSADNALIALLADYVRMGREYGDSMNAPIPAPPVEADKDAEKQFQKGGDEPCRTIHCAVTPVIDTDGPAEGRPVPNVRSDAPAAVLSGSQGQSKSPRTDAAAKEFLEEYEWMMEGSPNYVSPVIAAAGFDHARTIEEELTTARATIAERDKRIAEWVIKALRAIDALSGIDTRVLLEEGFTVTADAISAAYAHIEELAAVLAHAAEGKEQA